MSNLSDSNHLSCERGIGLYRHSCTFVTHNRRRLCPDHYRLCYGAIDRRRGDHIKSRPDHVYRRCRRHFISRKYVPYFALLAKTREQKVFAVFVYRHAPQSFYWRLCSKFYE